MGAVDDFAEWPRARLADPSLVRRRHVRRLVGLQRWPRLTGCRCCGEHNAVTWPYGDFVTEARAAVPRVAASSPTAPLRAPSPTTLRRPGRASARGTVDCRRVRRATAARLSSPRVTFAGRLHPQKGPDVPLRALARLPHPPATPPQSATVRWAIPDRPVDRPRPGRSALLPGCVVCCRALIVAGASAHVFRSGRKPSSQSAVLGWRSRGAGRRHCCGGAARDAGAGRRRAGPAEKPVELAHANRRAPSRSRGS